MAEQYDNRLRTGRVLRYLTLATYDDLASLADWTARYKRPRGLLVRAQTRGVWVRVPGLASESTYDGAALVHITRR